MLRFLGDMGVSPRVVAALREMGFDATHLYEEHLERLPDDKILEKGKLEGRVVLTFDLDFGDLLSAGALSLPSVILFRMSNQKPQAVLARLRQILSECQTELENGALILIQDSRYRVRPLPIERPEP